MIRTYGKHTCKRCGKAPIMTFPQRDAASHEMRRYYLPPKSKRSKPELWNIFYPTVDHPARVCEFCDRVLRGFFGIVPIVDIVRKMGRGQSLSPGEVTRWQRHQKVQQEDSSWN